MNKDLGKWITEHKTTFKNDKLVPGKLVIEGDGTVIGIQLMAIVGAGFAIGVFKWHGFLAVIAVVILAYILEMTPKKAE